jgi:Phage integrase, N-terminal SAM-like domain
MFRAQRVRNVDGSTSATVLGPEGVVAPVEKYLAFLDDLNRSSHTVRGYASDLALYFEFLSERGVEWPAAAMADLAAFSAYLRRTNRAWPSDGVVLLREPAPMRAAASCQRALTAVMGFYDFHQDTALAAALVRSRQHRTNVRSDSSRSRRHPVGVKVPSRIKPHLSESELASVLARMPTASRLCVTATLSAPANACILFATPRSLMRSVSNSGEHKHDIRTPRGCFPLSWRTQTVTVTRLAALRDSPSMSTSSESISISATAHAPTSPRTSSVTPSEPES